MAGLALYSPPMCGRYVLKRRDLEALARRLGVQSREEFRSRYNVAPASVVPLIRKRPAGRTELAGVRWGLIPAWTKPDAPLKPLVNVRSETLVTRFRDALPSRRCILPASGFYEWQTVGARKQPWYFARRDEEPFGLAGIWDTWRSTDGMAIETCTVLTTAPNAVLAPIHDRMPVLLTPAQCETWLQAPIETAVALLQPAPAEATTGFRVGPAVGNARNDGPECIAPAPDGPGEAEPQLSLGL